MAAAAFHSPSTTHSAGSLNELAQPKRKKALFPLLLLALYLYSPQYQLRLRLGRCEFSLIYLLACIVSLKCPGEGGYKGEGLEGRAGKGLYICIHLLHVVHAMKACHRCVDPGYLPYRAGGG